MLTSPRNTLVALLGLFVIWFIYFGDYVSTPQSSTPSTAASSLRVSPEDRAPASKAAPVLPSHIQTYFDQIFSSSSTSSSSLPPVYDFPGVAAACARTEWKPENSNVYLQCGGIVAGMTSIVSQVKVCFKMAMDAGVHVVLPTIPLRDSVDLQNFNLFNGSAYMGFDAWFDEAHLRDALGRACPQLKIAAAAEVEDPAAAVAAATQGSSGSLKVAHRWNMDISTAKGFKMFTGYFWVGRPFRTWFEHELLRLRFFDHLATKDGGGGGGGGDALQARQLDTKRSVETPTDLVATAAHAHRPRDEDGESPGGQGITIVEIASQFLIFRVTEDPTGRELALWNDLSALIRFNEATRAVTTRVEALIDQAYVGIHFRVEKDNIWSSYEDQLKADLDALDKMWTLYGDAAAGGKPGTQPQGAAKGAHPAKPLVYLACGDEAQIKGFQEAAALRGWNVTSKYDVIQHDAETLRQLRELPFDFQGAVDMGIMLKSWFFMGITGSAFSSTVANLRDSTGRYRGSSLLFPDDDHARTHLFNDGDATSYACCL